MPPRSTIAIPRRRAPRYNRHGNYTKRQLVVAAAAQSPPIVEARRVAAVQSAPSSSSPPAMSQRRNSFEAFASLDAAIAGMVDTVHQMAQIMQNVPGGAPCPSTSSIEQAVFLSQTFDAVQPLMARLQEDVAMGMQLFGTPELPSRELLVGAAARLENYGENLLTKFTNDTMPTSWVDMNRRWKVFSLCDRHVMGYMRMLTAQSPTSLPIFPARLHTGNTYVLLGEHGAYFIGEEFLCRAPIPTPGAGHQNVNAVHQNEGLWQEASDTDDEESD
ncbi:unnamed protein product [Caenorhabditis bovis]|uniref:Uncharacterized protein n=1 Tax=Caenorhabditis bovis TaxID=2654633 RepID=A0A8S1EKN1_9PELO|nr:unnamed protein product [Caenorhabditis bovis]